jgi:hypothetical protein
MRRTYKYSAVTRDEGNAADGHYQAASEGDMTMEWLAIGIAAFAVTAYTMILYIAGNRKETE